MTAIDATTARAFINTDLLPPGAMTAEMDEEAVRIVQRPGVIKMVMASNARIDPSTGSLCGYALALHPSTPFDSAAYKDPLVRCTVVFALDQISDAAALNRRLAGADLPEAITAEGLWTDNAGTHDYVSIMDTFPCPFDVAKIDAAAAHQPGGGSKSAVEGALSAHMSGMPPTVMIVNASVPGVNTMLRERFSHGARDGRPLHLTDIITRGEHMADAFTQTFSAARRIARMVADASNGLVKFQGSSPRDTGPVPCALWWSNVFARSAEPLSEAGGHSAAVYYSDAYAAPVTSLGASTTGWLMQLPVSQGALWVRGPRVHATRLLPARGRITAYPRALSLLSSGVLIPASFTQKSAPVLGDGPQAMPVWPTASDGDLESITSIVHSTSKYPLLEAALALPADVVDVHSPHITGVVIGKLAPDATDHVHLRTVTAVLSQPHESARDPSNYVYALTHSEELEFRVPLTRELKLALINADSSGVALGAGGRPATLAEVFAGEDAETKTIVLPRAALAALLRGRYIGGEAAPA